MTNPTNKNQQGGQGQHQNPGSNKNNQQGGQGQGRNNQGGQGYQGNK